MAPIEDEEMSQGNQVQVTGNVDQRGILSPKSNSNYRKVFKPADE
jgi:hypothetical protein